MVPHVARPTGRPPRDPPRRRPEPDCAARPTGPWAAPAGPRLGDLRVVAVVRHARYRRDSGISLLFRYGAAIRGVLAIHLGAQPADGAVEPVGGGPVPVVRCALDAVGRGSTVTRRLVPIPSCVEAVDGRLVRVPQRSSPGDARQGADVGVPTLGRSVPTLSSQVAGISRVVPPPCALVAGSCRVVPVVSLCIADVCDAFPAVGKTVTRIRCGIASVRLPVPLIRHARPLVGGGARGRPDTVHSDLLSQTVRRGNASSGTILYGIAVQRNASSGWQPAGGCAAPASVRCALALGEPFELLPHLAWAAVAMALILAVFVPLSVLRYRRS